MRVYYSLLPTLQVLEGECHDAPCSGGSHQALEVGGRQREDQALLPAQMPACVERDEDGLVHTWRCPGHHAAYRVGQLLGHEEGLVGDADTQIIIILFIGLFVLFM